ncbi:alpha/beta hydrolase [[Mycobacterium] nativiensis]|uniref:Alpha/beta-hydrolase family protein n=1 Tax=[Mycobacterium] nativiensis TaxID=2855503 RepID=A0ABU5XU85_9MYCO|nr:alpha/beta-hydrolase family protein [Mycolicibacter sp. MYC340]MEB3031549.1 alpha/beta-hydrolase family protein [Mycolicibacter sp. MYC340]
MQTVTVPTAAKPWWIRRYTLTGTAVGVVFIWLSLTPSLLPRGPLFQGLVSGGSGAAGYGLGVFSVWLVRYLRSKDSSPPPPRWAWAVLLPVGTVGIIVMNVRFHFWQDRVRDLMGVDHLKWWGYPLAGVLAVVVLFLLVEVGQLIRRLTRMLVGQLNKIAPPRISAVIAVALLMALGVALLNGVVVKVAMRTMNNTFATLNDEMGPDTEPPSSSHRSGGPGSLASWESLGREGRVFVEGGPTVDQLTSFSRTPATEPVRAYAGLNSADGIEATAELAAAELERAGGLDRDVIAVATTTGTGWVNEAHASALEYLFNGNTAIVSMQYSFLPSWLSFLVDKENARQAGQALFEAVDARVRRIPEAKRPKVVVFGESLGSFGGEAPFMSLNNVLARTDGAVFSGPTFQNTIWTELTTHRDPGSPEVLPIYHDGLNVRFAARPGDLARPSARWSTPRVVYLQHASDPIAWWNPDLLFKKPDWLSEPRGYDVLPEVNWKPVVTFLQVSADMAVAINVPDGHGHSYQDDIANAWAAVLQPPGWTPEQTERLRHLLHSGENS